MYTDGWLNTGRSVRYSKGNKGSMPDLKGLGFTYCQREVRVGGMHSFDPFTVESVVFLTISELKSSPSLLARWYACLGRFDNARLFCNNKMPVKLFIHFPLCSRDSLN